MKLGSESASGAFSGPRLTAVACAAMAVVAVVPSIADGAALQHSVVVQRFGGDANFNGYGPGTPGTGDVPATLSAVPLFFDEFSQGTGTATRYQTIALPTVVGSGTGARAVTDYYRNDYLTGYMSLSADGQFLVTTGYNSAVGTADPAGSGTGTDPRRPLALLDMDGTLTTNVTYRWSSSTAQRSVAAPSIDKYYIVTDSSAQGTRFTERTGSTNIAQQTPSNSAGRIHAAAHRVVRIFENRLFLSTGSTASGGPGLLLVDGPGLPTASTSTAFSLGVTPFAVTASSSPEGFYMLDATDGVGFGGTNLDTAYVALSDAGTNPATAGLQKWTYDGSSWSLAYTLARNTGFHGVDFAGFDSNGDAILYATTGYTQDINGSIQNFLLRVVDDGAAFSWTTAATSPLNTYFRGVSVVPEPGAASVLLLAGMSLLVRRRGGAN